MWGRSVSWLNSENKRDHYMFVWGTPVTSLDRSTLSYLRNGKRYILLMVHWIVREETTAQGWLWERVTIIYVVNEKFTSLVIYLLMPLLRSQKVKYAWSPRRSVLPIKCVVGVWLMDLGRASLNTNRRHKQTKNRQRDTTGRRVNRVPFESRYPGSKSKMRGVVHNWQDT